MRVELVTTPDSDLKIVNAARVSFDKESTEFSDRDAKLLRYLAKHKHWTPFSHVRETFCLQDYLEFHKLDYTDIAGMVWRHDYAIRHSLWGWANLLKKRVLSIEATFDVISTLSAKYPEAMKALGLFVEIGIHLEKPIVCANPNFIDVTMRETIPIFVARQRFKHMIGFTYNEVSRRYVDDDPEFFVPDEWRARPDESIKQGSAGLIEHQRQAKDIHIRNRTKAECEYKTLLGIGVAPEQARMVLPQSMYTSYYVTGSLSAWARAYRQRIDAHAQKEIQDLAKQWDQILTELHGDVWKELIS